MKLKYLSLALVAFFFTACNNTPQDSSAKSAEEGEQVTETTNTAPAQEPAQEPAAE